nr:hypothetical protein CFP56_13757 [Quercus suber]
MIIYWRDAASTWEVDTAFKPSGVLFSSILGSIAPDMIIYWSLYYVEVIFKCMELGAGMHDAVSVENSRRIIYYEALEKLEQVQLPRNNDSFEMDVKISPKINKGFPEIFCEGNAESL